MYKYFFSYSEAKEAREMAIISPSEIRDKFLGQGLPPRALEDFTATEVINHLVRFQDGHGVLYKVHRSFPPEKHKQHLRVAAHRLGLKIQIVWYDHENFLVISVGQGGRELKKLPVILTPQEVERFNYATKNEKTMLPGFTGEAKSYVAVIFDENVRADVTGEGILYPLNNSTVNQQQIRLHVEAKEMGFKIRTRRWDEEHLLITFNGYW